ncbi:MAG: SBBP repeat-containing protein [Candidatus Thorarchaeota archaeon]
MTAQRIGLVLLIGLLLSISHPAINDILYLQMDDETPTAELNFSTFLGGQIYDTIHDIELDQNEDIIICGTTASEDFPTTEGAYDTTHSGESNSDCFVMKLSGDGQEILFSTFIGGSEDDAATNVAVDSEGNIGVVGRTYSSNFPTLQAYDDSYNSGGDCFVLMLSSNGSTLLSSTYVGGSGTEIAYDFVIDSNDDCYVVGYTESTDFPVNTVNNQSVCHSLGGTEDGYVFKLGNNGSDFIYSMYLGGDGSYDTTYSIALDSEENPIIVGYTRSSDFPIVAALDDEMGGLGDCYVVKLNPDGGFNFSTYYGGSDLDGAYSVGVDVNDQIYITGLTDSVDFPINGIQNEALNGSIGILLLILGADGNSTVLSGVVKDSSKEGIMTSVSSLIVVSEREVWLGGITQNDDYPTTADAFDDVRNGTDIFVTKIDPITSAVNYSSFFGGSKTERFGGFTIDSSYNVIGVGETESRSLPVKNALQPSKSGINYSSDGFLVSMKFKGSATTTITGNTTTTTITGNTTTTTTITTTTLDTLVIQIMAISIGLVVIVIAAVVIKKSR